MRGWLLIAFVYSGCGNSQTTRYTVTTATDAERQRFARAVAEDKRPAENPGDMDLLGLPRRPDGYASHGSVDQASIEINRVSIASTEAAIIGRVLASTDHEPLAGVTLVVAGTGQMFQAVTNSDGGFAIDGLRPGEYGLSAYYGSRSAHHARFTAIVGTAALARVVMPDRPNVHLLAVEP